MKLQIAETHQHEQSTQGRALTYKEQPTKPINKENTNITWIAKTDTRGKTEIPIKFQFKKTCTGNKNQFYICTFLIY